MRWEGRRESSNIEDRRGSGGGNFTPYVVASLLFILMSVPFILLNDWYTERLRKRELSGGTV